MDCSSIDVDGDGEYCVLLKDKVRTARKQHKCDECKGAILPKEKYRVQVTLYDRKLDEFKTCAGCMSVIREMFSGTHMFGSMWDDIETHIDEMGGDISETCLTSLHPKARQKICDMIEQYHYDTDDEDDE